MRNRIPFKEWAKTIYNDFRKFDLALAIQKGYPFHALIAYILADFYSIFIAYPLIVYTLVFISGIAIEFYRLIFKKIKIDYADVRWMLYICLVHYLINLF